ncbi:hypothetical protein BO83DRAFT_378412 [Aspergillus eucalypticola CBS 122712]|uniref:Uncharacterized protein n=1 Tax=Aspergillus eucalypticola (strain CBS 122712 / IBT 29274) TaxID=1448314 RepID=A0A317VJB6_ASPEC|nr:uncharacterized protein BO83DRAFT_378412 [Aspergillus eucalypticola CBS 122712]PWY73331.1 hypothetical protein BO83DRAFT_378412 [Aspergillus eucalypticola CBS 122712]
MAVLAPPPLVIGGIEPSIYPRDGLWFVSHSVLYDGCFGDTGCSGFRKSRIST